MKVHWAIALVFVSAVANCSAQTPMDVQPAKPVERSNTLGTCGYKPTEKEAPFFKKLDGKEQATGSFMKEYDIHKKKNNYVSWFGVVRGIADTTPDGRMTLLLEQKAFDGMTDCHIMLVSASGYGDFKATLGPVEGTIPLLSLIRIYGKVDEETNGTPHIAVEYVRVWPWLTFTFTDIGPGDRSNPQWAKFCRICKGGKVYQPFPRREYYLGMLGDPKEFGTVPETH
jgi:hypothetical protein